MGYTHYWSVNKKAVDAEQYKSALKDIAKIVSSQKNILAGGDGAKGTKPSTKGAINFNGVESDSHETFFLPFDVGNLKEFDFCKTAQKPYDIVVVAALARLAEVQGFTISSDGDTSDMAEGIALASKVLGRKVANPLKKMVKSFVERVNSGYAVKAWPDRRSPRLSGLKMKDSKKALECIQFILDTENEDYHDQARDHGVDQENWEDEWDKVPHIYVAALLAVGLKPDPSDFQK